MEIITIIIIITSIPNYNFIEKHAKCDLLLSFKTNCSDMFISNYNANKQLISNDFNWSYFKQ